jgi:6-pyruvoyltetrahydropterin/6-carboxytetrahydropterin synthase
MSDDVFEISKAASFDAAHFLPVGPDEHRYRRMHGHSFRVEATLRGTVDAKDAWVADLDELKKALDAAAAGLDHSVLNEQPGLETPTLERLCLYFAGRLRPAFPGLCKVVVARPSVGESCALALG